MAEPLYRDKEWLETQVEKGLDNKEIALLAHCAASTISKWRHRLGLFEGVSSVVERRCEICDKVFFVEPAQKGRFCSTKCYGVWRSESLVGSNSPQWMGGGSVTTTCAWCGQDFNHSPSQKCRFCSFDCYTEWRNDGNVPTGPDNPKWDRVKQVCEYCGAEFWVKPSILNKGSGKFCSRACQGKWISENMSGEASPFWKQIPKTCEYCGAEFTVPPCYEGIYHFCSQECRGQWYSENKSGANSPHWQRTLMACEICGKEFWVKPAEQGDRRFCSKKCYGDSISGDNSKWWRGGISFEPYPPMFNRRFKQMIRRRDEYTCAICGKYPSRCVHHINYVKEDTDPGNCITLCNVCHGRTNHNRNCWQRKLYRILEERLG